MPHLSTVDDLMCRTKEFDSQLRQIQVLRRHNNVLTRALLCSAVSAACLPQPPGVGGRASAAVGAAAVPGGGTERAPRPADPGPAPLPGGDAQTELLQAQSSPSAPQVAAYAT